MNALRLLLIIIFVFMDVKSVVGIYDSENVPVQISACFGWAFATTFAILYFY